MSNLREKGFLRILYGLFFVAAFTVFMKPINVNAETYETDQTLTSDVTINGDLTIANKAITINLNGHKLTVTGNLLQCNGTMNINGGTLNVGGDYRIQKTNTNNTDGYDWSDGCLVMNNSKDVVIVKGSFVTSSDANGSSTTPNNILTAGKMEVYGNFAQVNHGFNTEAFPADGTKVVLCGTKQQKISFDNPTNSYFSDLSLVNTDVVVEKPMRGFKMTEDLEFANGLPNGIYGNMDVNGYSLTVGGDMLLGESSATATSASWGVFNVNGGEVLVAGNLRQDASVLKIGGGTMTVQGNYRLQRLNSNNTDGYDWSDGCLVMDNAADVLRVEGSFYTSSDANGNSSTPNNVLTAGKFYVGGNFSQVDHGFNTEAFPANGTKVYFDGKDGIKQNIYFDNPYNSYFSDVATINTNIDVLTMMGGWTLSEDVTFNKIPVGTCRDFNMNGYTLTVNGDMVIGDKGKGGTYSDVWGNVTLGYNSVTKTNGKLIVKGNIRQDAGTLKVENGTLTIGGDYRIQKVNTNNPDGYDWSDGCIVMEKAGGKVIVSGSFYTSSDANGSNETPSNILSAGEFHVGGDFSQIDHGFDTRAFPASGTKVYFDGKNGKKQSIYFDNPYNSYFSDVATVNTNIDVLTMMGGWTLSENVTFNKIPFGTCRNFDLNGYTLVVKEDMVIGDAGKGGSNSNIWGNVTLGYNKSTNTYGSLIVQGNLRQDAGTLTVGGGTVRVGGDYRIQKVNTNNTDGYDWTDGCIVMDDESGYVYVGGSFYTSSDANGSSETPSNVLTAGTMEVKGDFKQVNHGFDTKAYPAEGTHKLILSGTSDTPQYITFDNYPNSHLNKVILTRDSSYYIFSPADCYSNISTSQVEKTYMIIFDANGGSLNKTYTSVKQGDAYGTLPVPANPNGTFLGWFTDRSEGVEVNETDLPTDNITLYAHYEINECTHDNTELRNQKDATETEDGYTGDTYCTDCEQKIADGEAIPAKGKKTCTHDNTELRNQKAATETEPGYTGDTYCTDCEQKIADGEVIPATNSGETTTQAPTTQTPTTEASTTEQPTTQATEDATTIGDDDEIEVAQVKNVKLTNKRVKRIYISYSPVSGANGYEIRYATKKSMSGSKKMTAKVTKGYFKTAKGKKASFKKGKTYYVQVRAYVKDSDGDKVYGPWSVKKKVKIKK